MKECLKKSKENRSIMLEGREDIVGLATDYELKIEIEFLVKTLHLLNCTHPLIRKVRSTVFDTTEINTIENTIATLKEPWNCKRAWEDKHISITPKWHLFFTIWYLPYKSLEGCAIWPRIL